MLRTVVIRSGRNHRDELSILDNVLLKGNRIIIPSKLRPAVLEKLHTGHLGIEKTKRLARTSVFWPRINHDIEQMLVKCVTCLKYQDEQTAEPLMHHSVPEHPWQHLATDFCVHKGPLFILSRSSISNNNFSNSSHKTFKELLF